MQEGNFDQVNEHFGAVLGIDLEKHIHFKRKSTLKHYSLTGALLVLYRYAEELGQKIVVHDMTTGGHKSHQLGTELDFDFDAKRKNADKQVNIVSDLLRIRDVLRSDLNAFRIGFYFDHLNNTSAKTYSDFKDMYKKVDYSMHLGVRFNWTSPEYKGNKASSNYDKFSLWGKGSRHYGKKNLWIKRIRSWNIGHIKARADSVAANKILPDFQALDMTTPAMTVLGAY